MSCAEYERYELGQLEETHYRAHTENCRDCQLLQAGDEALLSLCGELRLEVDVEPVWQRIENDLGR